MKYQVFFSLKKMKKYSRLSSAAAMIGAIRVNGFIHFSSPEQSSGRAIVLPPASASTLASVWASA